MTKSFAICIMLLFGSLIPFAMKRRRAYNYSTVKVFITLVVLVFVVGYLCSKLFAYISFGSFYGRKFYGSVFMAPFVMMLYSAMLKERAFTSSDFIAPFAGICNAIMKIPCFFDGCSYGIVLLTRSDGGLIRFPSNIVEILFALCTVFYIIHIENKGKSKDLLLPIWMTIYGFSRYIFGWLRGDPNELVPYIGNMPAQRFWPLVDGILGIILIISIIYYNKKKLLSFKELINVILGNGTDNKDE